MTIDIFVCAISVIASVSEAINRLGILCSLIAARPNGRSQ